MSSKEASTKNEPSETDGDRKDRSHKMAPRKMISAPDGAAKEEQNEHSGTESSIQVAEIFPQIQSLIKNQSALSDSLDESVPEPPGKDASLSDDTKGMRKRKSKKPHSRRAKKPLPNAEEMRTVPAIKNDELPISRGFSKRPRGTCEACEMEEGMYRYGAILCPYCWWFYYKNSHRAAKLRCADLWCKDENGMCNFVKLGIKCPYCRMQKMFAMGIRLPDFLPHTGFCRACNGRPCGKHYGNFVCKDCALFFKRSHAEDLEFNCTKERRCKITFETRDQCHFCWLQRCYDVGMTLGEPSGFPEPCCVCGVWRDTVASHYGVMSCQKCSAFFFRCYTQYQPESFRCQKKDKCVIGAGGCMYCTFHKCLLVGMEPIYRVKMSEEVEIAKEKFMQKSRNLVAKTIKPEPAESADSSDQAAAETSKASTNKQSLEFEPKKHLPKFLMQKRDTKFEFKQQTMSEEKKKLRIRNTLSRIRRQLRGGRGDDDLFVQNMEQLNYYSSTMEQPFVVGSESGEEQGDLSDYDDEASMASLSDSNQKSQGKKRKLEDKSSESGNILWSPQQHEVDASIPKKLYKKKKKRSTSVDSRSSPGSGDAGLPTQEGSMMEMGSDLSSEEDDLESDDSFEDSSSSMVSQSGGYVAPGPVECPVCTLPYASYMGLCKHAYDIHLAVASKGKGNTWIKSADIWYCEPCGKNFDRNSISFDAHYDQVHRSQFVCPLCDHKFPLIERLHEHLKKFHNVAAGSPLLKHIQPSGDVVDLSSNSSNETNSKGSNSSSSKSRSQESPSKDSGSAESVTYVITPTNLCHICGVGMYSAKDLGEHYVSAHGMQESSDSNTAPTLLDELFSSMFTFGGSGSTAGSGGTAEMISRGHEPGSSLPEVDEGSMHVSSTISDHAMVTTVASDSLANHGLAVANSFKQSAGFAHIPENPYGCQSMITGRQAGHLDSPVTNEYVGNLPVQSLTHNYAGNNVVSEVLRLVGCGHSVLCEICGELVEEDNSMLKMLAHRGSEHGLCEANGGKSKDFPCSLCDFVFPKLSMLEEHIRAHPPVMERIVCDMCQDTGWFNTMTAARSHMLKIHLCRYRPSQPLKKARKTPKRSRSHGATSANYQCEHCDQAFDNKHDISVHMQFAHDNPQFKCPECNFMAHSEGEKEYHMQSMHAARSGTTQRSRHNQSVPSQDLVNFYTYDNLHKSTKSDTALQYTSEQDYGGNDNSHVAPIPHLSEEKTKGDISCIAPYVQREEHSPYSEPTRESRGPIPCNKPNYLTKTSSDREYPVQNMPSVSGEKDWSTYTAYRNLPEYIRPQPSPVSTATAYQGYSRDYRKTLQCSQCSFVGISEGEREYHMKVMHQSTPRPSQETAPNPHLESYSTYQRGPPPSAHSDVPVSSSMSYVELMREDRQLLQCPECGYVATCEGGWVYHMQVVHPSISRAPLAPVPNQHQETYETYSYSSRTGTPALSDVSNSEQSTKQMGPVRCPNCSFMAASNAELMYHTQVSHCSSTDTSANNIPSQGHRNFLSGVSSNKSISAQSPAPYSEMSCMQKNREDSSSVKSTSVLPAAPYRDMTSLQKILEKPSGIGLTSTHSSYNRMSCMQKDHSDSSSIKATSQTSAPSTNISSMPKNVEKPSSIKPTPTQSPAPYSEMTRIHKNQRELSSIEPTSSHSPVPYSEMTRVQKNQGEPSIEPNSAQLPAPYSEMNALHKNLGEMSSIKPTSAQSRAPYSELTCMQKRRSSSIEQTIQEESSGIKSISSQSPTSYSEVTSMQENQEEVSQAAEQNSGKVSDCSMEKNLTKAMSLTSCETPVSGEPDQSCESPIVYDDSSQQHAEKQTPNINDVPHASVKSPDKSVPDAQSHESQPELPSVRTTRSERPSRGRKKVIEDGKHFCKVCQKHLPSDTKMKEHLKEHKGQEQKQFVCSHCTMSYTLRYSRDLHELVTHMKMLPYPCERCPEKFASMNGLLKHTKVVHPKSAVTVSYSLQHLQQYIGLGKQPR